MTNTFLIELGLEEMPAHVVTPSIDQFEKKILDFLSENRLTFKSVKKYSTPRRLALVIEELSDRQEDIDEISKGPAKKIAQDDSGNWTKAAIGFAKGQKGDPDDIFFKEIKGTEYAYIKKHEVGLPSNSVLKDINKPIEDMVFPTRMHWGSSKFEYIRPIHWLVAMLDKEVIDTKILDIQANNVTRGHRFLGHDKLNINDANSYVDTLEKDFVIVDADRRKKIIKNQIEDIARENNWIIDIEENLLEEVNNLVEYPTSFFGEFDEKYLDLPEEVLITSMKDNQRYFYARNIDGKMAPVFISVRNGNNNYIENVIKGNEKVLVARLEDARFFYQEDQKRDINSYVNSLKNVTFHAKLGSVYEKMQRTKIISGIIAQHIGLNEKEIISLDRASSIYKFDLVTNMVDEFPELQGVMGEKYSEIMGENSEVSTAIREHYMPTTAEGKLPESKIGSVLAIADKLDAIMSFFSVDIIPNGSNDPFALRRQAYGIDRILNSMDWDIDIDSIQDEIILKINEKSDINSADLNKHKNDVSEFIIERLRQYFKNLNLEHDIVETVLQSSTKTPAIIIEIAGILEEQKNKSDFKNVIESLSRVHKLTQKADNNIMNNIIDVSIFQNESEKELFDAVNNIVNSMDDESLSELFTQVKELYPLINRYFDENMIMDKNENIKNNRLTQLIEIDKIAKIFGNLSELVIK